MEDEWLAEIIKKIHFSDKKVSLIYPALCYFWQKLAIYEKTIVSANAAGIPMHAPYVPDLCPGAGGNGESFG